VHRAAFEGEPKTPVAVLHGNVGERNRQRRGGGITGSLLDGASQRRSLGHDLVRKPELQRLGRRNCACAQQQVARVRRARQVLQL